MKRKSIVSSGVREPRELKFLPSDEGRCLSKCEGGRVRLPCKCAGINESEGEIG